VVLWLVLPALVTGALVYCVLTIVAAAKYRAVRPPALRVPMPISILKPLAGVDDGLEENLRTFFEQDYAEFEILFAVRSPKDPAIAVVERLRAASPEFRAHWADLAVERFASRRRTFAHRDAGLLEFEHHRLVPSKAPDLHVVLYVPV